MKKCKGCGKEKSIDDFYRLRAISDGRFSKCKECVKQRVRENRAAKADYYREYDRYRYYTGGHRGSPSKEASAAASTRWLAKNGHKRAAHIRLNNAVRDGRVGKPDRCGSCGNATPSGQLQGHHRDYSSPLDVEWLCTTCHGLRHRNPGWEVLLSKPCMEGSL